MFNTWILNTVRYSQISYLIFRELITNVHQQVFDTVDTYNHAITVYNSNATVAWKREVCTPVNGVTTYRRQQKLKKVTITSNTSPKCQCSASNIIFLIKIVHSIALARVWDHYNYAWLLSLFLFRSTFSDIRQPTYILFHIMWHTHATDCLDHWSGRYSGR